MRILWWTGVLFSIGIGVLYSYQWLYLIIPRIRAWFSKKAVNCCVSGEKPRIAVCIAARNEESVLPHLLDSIHAQTCPADIYVIADNCTDDTASAARLHGATVYERQNRREIGKGYALSALWKHMQQDGVYDAYDAFLILDADNLLRSD